MSSWPDLRQTCPSPLFNVFKLILKLIWAVKGLPKKINKQIHNYIISVTLKKYRQEKYDDDGDDK